MDSQRGSGGLDGGLIEAVVSAATGSRAEACVAEVVARAAHTHDMIEVRLRDGRSLMVKHGRHDWSAAEFENSRTASALLRSAGVVAPEHVPAPVAPDGRPVEAYWRVELPTLAEAWPHLGERERRDALRSWGELLRRAHAVTIPGYGAIGGAARSGSPLQWFLAQDLAVRLFPAVASVWPAGLGTVEGLLEAIPEIAAVVGDRPGSLVHGDLHMGNVLCDVGAAGGIACVGFLDLEEAFSAPPEADLARAQLLHGPLFGRPLEEGWFEEVVDGYGHEPNGVLLAFFRVFALLNLGFHAALTGLDTHAAAVAEAAAAELPAVHAAFRRRILIGGDVPRLELPGAVRRVTAP